MLITYQQNTIFVCKIEGWWDDIILLITNVHHLVTIWYKTLAVSDFTSIFNHHKVYISARWPLSVHHFEFLCESNIMVQRLGNILEIIYINRNVLDFISFPANY